MRKEVVWAITVGIMLGLVLAIGLYRVNRRIVTQNNNNNKTKETPKPINNDFKITLVKPENEDVETQNLISVEGLTRPDSYVQIAGEENDYLVSADEKGNFQKEIKLIGGVNQIKITAFDKLGAKSEEKVIVVYSSLFEIIKPEELTDTDDTTQSAIRAKVQEKVNALLKKPKSYIGIVTDITDTTIELKAKDGQIRQVSITKEEIKGDKIKDVALGDWLVAMGYKDENQVLEAQRILIIDEPKEKDLNIVFGTISKVTKNSIFLGEEEYTFDKSAKVKFSSLEENQQVIIVGKRSLFVLE